MKNKNNYNFSQTDTVKIVNWMRKHLSVNWVEVEQALPASEPSFIQEHFPILNTTHNPHRVAELPALRQECRTIANTRSRPGSGARRSKGPPGK
jgi:hypothetical protein